MKVLLYTEGLKAVGKSGLGKAIQHQQKALSLEHIDYTLNPTEDYDILHINTYFPKSYLFAKKAKKHGKKVVYHAHSTEEDFRNSFLGSNLFSGLFKKWLIKCYSVGDVLITPTLYAKGLLEHYKGLENKKIYAISNGIEMEFFKRDLELGKKFRETYGYTSEDKVIIGIGLYIERKGIIDFVELAKRLPEYKFIWFGYSPLSASPQNVRDAVHTKLDNLTFAGYVERDMIRAAMCGCDLYLFPTLEETEGIPIVEACACKTKSLIRDIPNFDGWMIDGVNTYKAKNLDEFEEKIKKIISGELPDVTEKAYEVACERDLTTVGKRLHEVYDDLMKESN